MAGRTHGSVLKTVAGGSGAVGLANKAKMVYAMTIISGATASLATLRNGGSSGTIYIQELGTINKGVTFNYSEGFFFPAGCYFSDDTNETSVLISYEEYA